MAIQNKVAITEPSVEVCGVLVPRRVLVDILNCASNALYDQRKAASTELAAVDLESDTRSAAISNAVFGYDDASEKLRWIDQIEAAFKTAGSAK